jgi:lantibiotic modifying enzyme
VTSRTAESTGADSLLVRSANSLLARHVAGPGGGWAWRSSIQSPHLLTDRDVGAAGVAMGLLAAYQTTHRPAYLEGATQAGDWLLAVAQPTSPGGLRWPDWRDPHQISDTHFTSYDDGAAGISDLLWRLGSATGDHRFTQAALAGMRWLASGAEGVRGIRCPHLCRWRYYDDAADYRTGIGEGTAGVVYAFDLFARRTGERRYERYALGGARYLERLISPAGAIPEHPGRSGFDTGFLSGSAGDAFAFLCLYRDTGARRWLRDARRLLGWVRRQALPQPEGIAWPIEIDPHEGDDRQIATGIEEGAAGIGWVALQAYKLTHERAYLRMAGSAGDWLFDNTLDERGGNSWVEDVHQPLVHTSLDNGAPGIAWFLHDLAAATGNRDYEASARDARTWLQGVARADAAGIYWSEHRDGRGAWHLAREPSWHWGTAGIVAFLSRLHGWPVDMPGEEPGFR